MCGLAGCFGVRDETTINRMLDALPHRGPNDRGLHIHEDKVLGHTRLSIVDVACGHQPILANGGRQGIICNGEILWRYKVQYTQGAGCESLGEALAEKEMSEDEFQQIKAENPKATINSREAAYYFKIFRQVHPQDSILGSIGIWTGFDFAEERERVRGAVDGDLKHER